MSQSDGQMIYIFLVLLAEAEVMIKNNKNK